MAQYYGPNGDIFEATQLAEDTKLNSNTTGKKSEWLIRNPDGSRNLCVDAAFRQQFTQVFPRSADHEPQPINPGLRSA